MTCTYLGQSCFLIHTCGKALLFDPFISENPLSRQINLTDIHCDYILLSHGHGDHTADAERLAIQNDAVIISCFETVAWYQKKGIQGHAMNIGGKWQFPFGTVKSVAAVHSSVLPDGTYAGQAGGFVLWNEEACLYFAGDTALTTDMQLIPKTCPPLNAAILPLGDNFTMGVDDAVLAARFVECDNIVGCHFDTFDLIKIDHAQAREAFRHADKQLLLPTIGQTFDLQSIEAWEK